MNVRTVVAVALAGAVAAGAYAPADAAPKKKKPPLTKSYAMQLAPVPDPPQGTPSCARKELEGVSIHTESVKPTGPGTLKIQVSGFSGDWDITLYDAQHNEIATGDGTTTGGGAPATAGVDTLELSFKKAEPLLISMCNFAGTPNAKGTYTYTYK